MHINADNRLILNVILVSLSSVWGGLRAAYAQVTPDLAQQSLACFEQWHEIGRVGPSQCQEVTSVETFVILWQSVSPAVLDAVLDGLEQLALTSESSRVRIRAVVAMTTPGSRLSFDRGHPGIVDRASRVYRGSRNRDVKNTVLRDMNLQIEKTQAVAFLKAVAQENPVEDRGSEWPLAFVALTRLADMGPEGEAAIQQLRVSGEVSNPRARRFLQLPPAN